MERTSVGFPSYSLLYEKYQQKTSLICDSQQNFNALLRVLNRSRWVMQSKARNESALEHLHMRDFRADRQTHVCQLHICHICLSSLSLSLSLFVGHRLMSSPFLTICNERGEHWESDFAQSSRCAVHFHFSHFSLSLSVTLPHSLYFYFNFYLSSIRIYLAIASVDNLALACLISPLTVFSRSLRLAVT